MFNRRLLVYPGVTSEPLLPTKETVLWKGNTAHTFNITIPPDVKVLKITTENTYVNEFVDPNLLYRYKHSSNFKQWVSSYAGDPVEGKFTADIQIIMSYSASINGVTPNVLDY